MTTDVASASMLNDSPGKLMMMMMMMMMMKMMMVMMVVVMMMMMMMMVMMVVVMMMMMMMMMMMVVVVVVVGMTMMINSIKTNKIINKWLRTKHYCIDDKTLQAVMFVD